jgi:hypothetical protein
MDGLGDPVALATIPNRVISTAGAILLAPASGSRFSRR